MGLPHLTTLNIINIDEDVVRAVCECACDMEVHGYTYAAETVFDSIPESSKLSLLVFGEGYEYTGRLPRYSHWGDKQRYCFFRHVLMDPRMKRN